MNDRSNYSQTILSIHPTRLPLSARVERAHALKNCLAIVCAVNTLVESELSEAAQRRLSRSRNAVRRMTELIEQDLLADCGSPSRRQVEFVSAAQVLEGVRARVEDLAEARAVQVRFHAGSGGIRGDAHALTEALANLVMNAIQSSARGELVAVTSTASDDGGQEWTVQDTGNGIPPEALRQLGVPFVSSRKGGSGIGVAVACAVVEQHGGLVHVESVLGSGTLVSIWLPPCG